MGGFMKTASTASLALLLAIVTPGAAGESPGSAPATTVIAAPTQAEEPRLWVDVEPVPAPRRTMRVPADGNLQAALDSARPGDAILLEPGAEYRGPFTLPYKDGNEWIVIRSSAPDAELAAPGQRVQPAHTARMPRLVSDTEPVLAAAPGAHHYRLIGVTIAPSGGTFLRTLIDLGSHARELSAVPHDIIVDRCLVRGDAQKGARRGIALNARRAAVIDSVFLDFKEAGADSQAIAGWNGPGPLKIVNNHLEAAGENVMFGGADPLVRDLVPADIEIRRNVLTKPLRWKAGDPRYEGVAWTVKNLFELKNARRVLVEGNLFEYNWPQAQNGFAILFTVRNQDGGAPWSVVEDVVFRGNVVRHVAAGVNILGHDDNHPSRQTSRIAIIDNVFADVGGAWGHGRLFQVLDGTRDVVIDHNTAFQTGSPLFGGDRRPHTRFVFRNNIVMAGLHSISGSGATPGRPSLDKYFPGADVRRNVFIGGDPRQLPDDNFSPTRIQDVGPPPAGPGEPFQKVAARYAGAGTDGRDPGAPSDAIIVLTAAQPAFAALATVRPAAEPFDSSVAAIFFWLAFAAMGYVCVGYPVLARLRAAINPRSRRRALIEPRVSVIIAAHNEAERIDGRLRNLLSLDYPADRIEIIVGSDGSTDDTVARARPFQSAGVNIRAFRSRRGKPAMLNALVPLASGEIIVFADARQRFDPLAIRALVSNFADPAVGAVSGELIMTAGNETERSGQGAAMYWNYEKLIRSTESRGGSTVGATGAIYAIRRSLFEPLPEDTILDDVLIPIRIARQGYRVVFEPGAKAFDVAPPSASAELARKARTIGGTFQLFARERWLLNPRSNPLWFETVSHKALRLALPVLLATLLVTNLTLADRWPYQVTLGGQAMFYAAAALGFGHRQSRRHRWMLTLPYTTCLLSWATVVGFFRFATAHQQVTWERIMSAKVRSHS